MKPLFAALNACCLKKPRRKTPRRCWCILNVFVIERRTVTLTLWDSLHQTSVPRSWRSRFKVRRQQFTFELGLRPVCTLCCCPLPASKRCHHCWGEPGEATSGCHRRRRTPWSGRRWSSPTPFPTPCCSGMLMGGRGKEKMADEDNLSFLINLIHTAIGTHDQVRYITGKTEGKSERREEHSRL